MDQPQSAETPPAPRDATPEERRALGYNAVARLAGADARASSRSPNYLREQGLSAPEIYAADPAQGFVLIEDLGDDLYADVLTRGGDERELYDAGRRGAGGAACGSRAVACLPPTSRCTPMTRPRMLAEIDLMTEWFVPYALGRAARAGRNRRTSRAVARGAGDGARTRRRCSCIATIMRRTCSGCRSASGAARVGLIDFQDAVAGSRAYDLISLIEDARRDVRAGDRRGDDRALSGRCATGRR